METGGIIISTIAISVLVVFLTRRGYARLDDIQRRDEQGLHLAEEKFGSFDLLGKVAYQGGLPDHPYAVYMRLGVKGDQYILFDDDGYCAEIPMSKCNEQDFFIVKQKSQSRFKSFVLFGPFAPMIFKDKFRHIISVNYTDINGEENNVVLEADGISSFEFIKEKMCNLFSKFKSIKNKNAATA